MRETLRAKFGEKMRHIIGIIGTFTICTCIILLYLVLIILTAIHVDYIKLAIVIPKRYLGFESHCMELKTYFAA